jgi:hypothetical protein
LIPLAYEKQTFANNETVLKAEHMDHIENGIYQNSVDVERLENEKLDADKVPVQSVNGKTGAVTLNADDVGARPDDWMPTAQEVGALPHTYTPPNQTAEQVGADPAGTAESKVSGHNTNAGAHNDIRLLITALATRLDALANSDDTTLDQMAEIVAYIKANRDLIAQVTTGKVSVADIINNLTTNVTNKPLSAAQGVALKALVDGLSSGKLDASKLTEAINTALAQAKASGEFDGEPGYTPQKYTDYFTPADQESIVQDVIEALGSPVLGSIEDDKNIVLSGDLPPKTYYLWFENDDGSRTELCSLKIERGVQYTNLIPTAEAYDSTNPYNGTGYKNGYYLSGSAPFEGTDTATVLTGYMPYTIPATGLPGTIYISGAEVQNISHCRIYFFGETKVMAGSGVQGTVLSSYFTIETLSNGVTKLTPIASGDSSKLLADSRANTSAKYFRMSLVGTGENLIITVNEPIE